MIDWARLISGLLGGAGSDGGVAIAGLFPTGVTECGLDADLDWDVAG